MEAILNLNFFFLFLIYSLGAFVGVLITRMFLTATIFPITKAIAASFGVTVLYLVVERFSRTRVEPYGDFLICMVAGLFAEKILEKILSPRGQSILHQILSVIILKFLSSKFDMTIKDIDDVHSSGKEGAGDERTTDKKDISETNSLGKKDETEGNETAEDKTEDPFRSKF